MADSRESVNFTRIFTNTAAIGTGTRWQLPLESIKTDFGLNFNTLIGQNNHSAQKVFIELNGNSSNAIPFPANGGTVSITKDDELLFSDVTVYNNSGTEIAIGAISITIGRTGRR